MPHPRKRRIPRTMECTKVRGPRTMHSFVTYATQRLYTPAATLPHSPCIRSSCSVGAHTILCLVLTYAAIAEAKAKMECARTTLQNHHSPPCMTAPQPGTTWTSLQAWDVRTEQTSKLSSAIASAPTCSSMPTIVSSASSSLVESIPPRFVSLRSASKASCIVSLLRRSVATMHPPN